MMRRQLTTGILLVLLFLPKVHYAQLKDGKDKLKAILGTLKEVKRMNYKYNMSIVYPDGTSQVLDGEAYVDNDNRELYNENNLQVIIYTGKWSYKADHTGKEVVVVDNEAHMNKKGKEAMEKQLFQNTSMGMFFDSVVMKRASVKSYKKSNDTVFIQLSFPANYAITSMGLKYDDAKQQLISYSMVTFSPWEGSVKGKRTGTTTSVNCVGFNQDDKRKKYATSNYFVVGNGKVTLKKYNEYKLSYKL